MLLLCSEDVVVLEVVGASELSSEGSRVVAASVRVLLHEVVGLSDVLVPLSVYRRGVMRVCGVKRVGGVQDCCWRPVFAEAAIRGSHVYPDITRLRIMAGEDFRGTRVVHEHLGVPLDPIDEPSLAYGTLQVLTSLLGLLAPRGGVGV